MANMLVKRFLWLGGASIFPPDNICKLVRTSIIALVVFIVGAVAAVALGVFLCVAIAVIVGSFVIVCMSHPIEMLTIGGIVIVGGTVAFFGCRFVSNKLASMPVPDDSKIAYNKFLNWFYTIVTRPQCPVGVGYVTWLTVVAWYGRVVLAAGGCAYAALVICVVGTAVILDPILFFLGFTPFVNQHPIITTVVLCVIGIIGWICVRNIEVIVSTFAGVKTTQTIGAAAAEAKQSKFCKQLNPEQFLLK